MAAIGIPQLATVERVKGRGVGRRLLATVYLANIQKLFTPFTLLTRTPEMLVIQRQKKVNWVNTYITVER